jgi:ribosomal protein L6P/L9E
MENIITHILPSGLILDAERNGRIVLTGTHEEQIVTTAAELAYILQVYQERFKGIPVLMDTSMWRGMVGNPPTDKEGS